MRLIIVASLVSVLSIYQMCYSEEAVNASSSASYHNQISRELPANIHDIIGNSFNEQTSIDENVTSLNADFIERFSRFRARIAKKTKPVFLISMKSDSMKRGITIDYPDTGFVYYPVDDAIYVVVAHLPVSVLMSLIPIYTENTSQTSIQSIRENTKDLLKKCILLRSQLQSFSTPTLSDSTKVILIESLDKDISLLEKVQSTSPPTKEDIITFLTEQRPSMYTILNLTKDIITTDYNKSIDEFSKRFPKGTVVYVVDAEDVSSIDGSTDLTILKNALISHGFKPFVVITTDTTASTEELGKYVISQVIAKPLLESYVLGTATQELSSGTSTQTTGVSATVFYPESSA